MLRFLLSFLMCTFLKSCFAGIAVCLHFEIQKEQNRLVTYGLKFADLFI